MIFHSSSSFKPHISLADFQYFISHLSFTALTFVFVDLFHLFFLNDLIEFNFTNSIFDHSFMSIDLSTGYSI